VRRQPIGFHQHIGMSIAFMVVHRRRFPRLGKN
jgi:hypothetical protein